MFQSRPKGQGQRRLPTKHGRRAGASSSSPLLTQQRTPDAIDQSDAASPSFSQQHTPDPIDQSNGPKQTVTNIPDHSQNKDELFEQSTHDTKTQPQSESISVSSTIPSTDSQPKKSTIEEDDIFSTIPNDNIPTLPDRDMFSRKPPPIEDEDDIFSSSKVSVKPQAPPLDEEDDLFADSKVASRSKVSIDEEDIFADSSLLKKGESDHCAVRA